MNEEMTSRWNAYCNEVAGQMFDHVKPFVTAISKVISDENGDYGEHWGSGSFVALDGARYLMTNEHVARRICSTPLAHQFFESESVVRLNSPIAMKDYPVDVALFEIEEGVWNLPNHCSQTIPVHRFAPKHQPVEGELLFLIGYSGERGKFCFETLISTGTPYLTQETVFPQEIGNPSFHFAIHYRPDLATRIDGSSRELPKPPGLSGSLVWNTRFVECVEAGKSWSPAAAQVTGIVWGWPSADACLLVTKAECISPCEVLKCVYRCPTN